MQTKATLKVVRTRVKRVLIYSMIENAPLSLLAWTQVANFISKRTTVCSYVPAKRLVGHQLSCPSVTRMALWYW